MARVRNEKAVSVSDLELLWEVERDRVVFFVDFDDTLIEAQPDPTSFVLPEEVRDFVTFVDGLCPGSVTLVTGRSVAQIDRFFAPVVLPVIGCHGCELRLDPRKPAYGLHPAIPKVLRSRLEGVAKAYAGCLVEDKVYTFTLHPASCETMTTVALALEKAVAPFAQAYAVVRYGNCFEVKPKAASKGDALARVLARDAVFSGCFPVYIGDDVGLDPSLRRVELAGGALVPVGPVAARHPLKLVSPARVRAFLRVFFVAA